VRSTKRVYYPLAALTRVCKQSKRLGCSECVKEASRGQVEQITPRDRVRLLDLVFDGDWISICLRPK